MGPRFDARKQERWLDLLRRWRRSQLAVREFCRQQRLSEANFYAWRRVLRERGLLDDPSAPVLTPAFVQVAASSAAAPPIEVVLSERRMLRVPVGFDAAALLQLVRLLEEPAC